MGERTRGVRSILGTPRIYGAFQRFIGTEAGRRLLVDSYLPLSPDTRLLDVGCANGRLLDVLPPVHYVGFDPNPEYIDAARATYGDRGRFLVGTVGTVDPGELGVFDVVVARGVLHHLDDPVVVGLGQLATEVLAPGGVFVSMDPCYRHSQRRVARFLANRDRGQNVRTADRYRELLSDAFDSIAVNEHHDLMRVPYDHAVVRATIAPRSAPSR